MVFALGRLSKYLRKRVTENKTDVLPGKSYRKTYKS